MGTKSFSKTLIDWFTRLITPRGTTTTANQSKQTASKKLTNQNNRPRRNWPIKTRPRRNWPIKTNGLEEIGQSKQHSQRGTEGSKKEPNFHSPLPCDVPSKTHPSSFLEPRFNLQLGELSNPVPRNLHVRIPPKSIDLDHVLPCSVSKET